MTYHRTDITPQDLKGADCHTLYDYLRDISQRQPFSHVYGYPVITFSIHLLFRLLIDHTNSTRFKVFDTAGTCWYDTINDALDAGVRYEEEFVNTGDVGVSEALWLFLREEMPDGMTPSELATLVDSRRTTLKGLADEHWVIEHGRERTSYTGHGVFSNYTMSNYVKKYDTMMRDPHACQWFRRYNVMAYRDAHGISQDDLVFELKPWNSKYGDVYPHTANHSFSR
ncbi:hypothetical protein [Vibrio breoganii]|uniref:hypothetical protein n=1 Tax=Vibrio breoganii TaxID=553239 RepID=UPI000C84B0A4|nr:hypothetical protein [Vibrio breoganii]PMM26356.1 hypothetical protein BCT59_02625 [Vibrio breoganii]